LCETARPHVSCKILHQLHTCQATGDADYSHELFWQCSLSLSEKLLVALVFV
jgi:hypothetical protein